MRSAPLTIDRNSNRIGQVHHLRCGELRSAYPLGAMVADRLYTGQRWEASLGLYDDPARFYDPALGRFLQPDPVVPERGERNMRGVPSCIIAYHRSG